MGTGLIMPAWRMTGRAAELAQLDAAIGAGGAGGIVLAGTAGAGKTRLLREALHRASRGGRDVVQVAATRCTAAIPFGAVASLLPRGGPAAGPPWELLRRAADHLTRPTSQAPLVVGADDVHLLEPESAALLHYLVLHGAVFLLAAVQAGEPAPDAVAALWKDGLACRLTVHPLPAAAMDDLLVQALGTAVQDGARQHIQWVTSGSPLLLRELLAGALDEGALVRQETGWGWKDQPYYGAALVEVVDGWLAALGDGSRTVLEVVACAEPLPAELLNELADRGALDPAAVETAERRGVISCGYSGSRQVMRPGHPIYGEVIRATLPRGKAQRIAGWLAGAGAGVGAGTRHRTGTPRPAPAAVPTVDGLPLTRREHEIALLATSGLTSKAIAASLHLSVRTVNNHLARTYAKAGISCRAELAAIMTRTALTSRGRDAGLPAAPPAGRAARRGRRLAALDQRQLTAAVVVDTGRPDLATDDRDTAEDVAPGAGIRAAVHRPAGAPAAQDERVVAVAPRLVQVRADRPYGPVPAHREPVQISPVRARRPRQAGHLPGTVPVLLDERAATAGRAVRLPGHPDLAVRHGDGVEQLRRGRGRGQRHD